MTDANIVIGIKGELGDAPTIKRNLDEISQKGKEATASNGKLDQSFQKLNKPSVKQRRHLVQFSPHMHSAPLHKNGRRIHKP